LGAQDATDLNQAPLRRGFTCSVRILVCQYVEQRVNPVARVKAIDLSLSIDFQACEHHCQSDLPLRGIALGKEIAETSTSSNVD
jgi:hypothetical protein